MYKLILFVRLSIKIIKANCVKFDSFYQNVLTSEWKINGE